MDILHGHVTAVAQEIRGDEASTLSGDDGFLYVYDTADFDEDGGWLRTTEDGGGEVFVEYSGLAGSDFPGSGQGVPTILLSTPVAVAEGTRVEVWNPSTQDVVSEWVATVADDLDGSAIVATVSHALIDLLGDGIRGLVGESVVCERDPEDDGAWTVVQALGKAPLQDGAFIEPDTVPVPDVVLPADPPATSPALTVVGLAESFILRTESVAATTHLTFEVSVDGVTYHPFPDMPVWGTVYPAKRLPAALGGGPFQATTGEGEAATPVPYWFRVTAGNLRGQSPAGPSAAVQSQLDTSAMALFVQQLITEEVIAGFALAGAIEVGGDNFTLLPPDHPDYPDNPAGGLRIQLSNGGLIHLPADGSGAKMTGLDEIEVQNLDVDGLEIRGASHLGGQIEVGATIGDPDVPPTVEVTYTSLQSQGPTASLRGLCRSIENDGWVYVSDRTLVRINDAGVVVDTGLITSNTDGLPLGVVRIGTAYYTLRSSRIDGGAEGAFFYRFDSTLTQTGVQFVEHGDWGVTYPPDAIGTDGTNIIVAVRGSNVFGIRWSRWTTAFSLVDSGDLSLASLPDRVVISAIHRGVTDIGVDRWIVHPRQHDVRVYSTAGARQTADEWPRPFGHQLAGMWWDGTNFWCLNGVGTIRKLESPTAAPAETRYWSYTYRDADTHTTSPSPVAALTRPKRARVQVTAPPAPQESSVEPHAADRIAFWAASTSGGTKFQQGAVLPVGQRSAEFVTVTLSGTPAPANNFSGVVNPGEIHAEVGDFYIDGNSNGSVGTGTFRGSVQAAARDGLVAYPHSQRTKTSAQAIPNATPTTLTWQPTSVERGGPGVNGAWTVTGGVFTIPQTGKYSIDGFVAFGANTTGRRLVKIIHNGSDSIFEANVPAPPTGLGMVPFGRTYDLTAGDTIAIEVEHNVTGGGSIDVQVGTDITVSRIG